MSRTDGVPTSIFGESLSPTGFVPFDIRLALARADGSHATDDRIVES